MGYPTTDWPGSVDNTLVRHDNIDIVWDDDFNYSDEQIRVIQSWLGVTGDLLGEGIAGEGIGGAVSPIADGGTAFTFAARDPFTTGKLLSVGDNYDGTYVEKFKIDADGNLWMAGSFSFGAGGTGVTHMLDFNTQTTDGSDTVAWSLPVNQNETVLVVETTGAMQDTGGNSNAYKRAVLVRRPPAGSLAIIGTQKDMLTIEDQTAWDNFFGLNGDTLELYVKGAAGITVDWTTTLEYILLT